MKEALQSVSEQIIDILEKRGSISLIELEQTLGTSYNLLFLAIDSMASKHQIDLKKSGRDYLLSGVNAESRFHGRCSCVKEHSSN